MNPDEMLKEVMENVGVLFAVFMKRPITDDDEASHYLIQLFELYKQYQEEHT